MRPLVFVHGFTGAPASFGSVSECWTRAAGPRPAVYCPRLLGHGAPVEAGVKRFDQEVDRLAADIARRGLRGAHLCGYSLGARVSLGLLARHAWLFASATLISVHPGLTSDAERAARVGADERWSQLLLERGLRAFVDAWEAQPLFASRAQLEAARRLEQRRVRLRHDARGLARALRVLGLGQMPCYRGVLRMRPLPVRLLVGELDRKFVEVGRELSAATPRVTLEVMPGAGHDLPFEVPERVAAVLIRAVEA